MPKLKSAKKKVRQAEVRRKRNFAIRDKIKTTVKEVNKLIEEKKYDEVEKKMPELYRTLDMAAKKRVIHAKKAARKKSRLTKKLNKVKKA